MTAERHRLLADDLRRAVTARELELFYQPIARTADDGVQALEALLRWRHPVHGLTLPATFVDVAEQTNMIANIGEWALHEACHACTSWHDPNNVAVNVSPVQFVAMDMVAVVKSALETSGLPPRRLELEITETASFVGRNRSVDALLVLREMGVRVAIDDFGTGESGLRFLSQARFDSIKIDRGFVADLEGENSQKVVESIAQLANNLDMICVAEGVETTAQLDRITALGCDRYQGNLFSPPMPANQVAAFVSKGRPMSRKELTAPH